MTAATSTAELPSPNNRPPALPKISPVQAIPLRRVTLVELRKMFDTRSGFWLMASIVIAALLATGAIIVFAPDRDVTYQSFAAAIGFPMTIILPMIAILSVTSEWSQRSGLTTFTLVPHRGRVMLAKAIAAVTVAVVSMALAMTIGVIGNVLGSAIAGVNTSWDASVSDLLYIVLGNVLGLLIGFMLGVLIRNSAGAIVGYFVFSLVLPTLSNILAVNTHWFDKLQPWVDFKFAQSALFDGHLTATQWANLGVASLIWLITPLAIGVALVMRSEVK